MTRKKEIPEIITIGLSHKTAPVELREKFALNDELIRSLLDKTNNSSVDEIVYVSTCNRVEIYMTSKQINNAIDTLIGLIEEFAHLKREDFEGHLYKMYSRDAVMHLLNVASSLDSMVIGENEILGQVKESYRNAVKLKKTGTLLNRLFHQAFNTAKKVRTETEIAQNPLSIAYIATELAKQIFEDISKRSALLIGAGEMGELILKYFTKDNIKEITIANRSLSNAERIADEINKEAHIILLDDIEKKASEVDIIISSVTSQDYIITAQMVNDISKRKGNQPLFMIDIAVPRNIDPAVAKLHNIFLYNIDDLKSISDENLKNRLKEVEMARQLVDADASDFIEWYEGLEIVPTIVKIQNKFDHIRKNEINRYRRRKLKHLSDKDFSLVEELTKQIMTKTLHNPIATLKKYKSSGDRELAGKKSLREKTKIIEELFE